jgi:GNAT superfamily N-acetyltransferase
MEILINEPEVLASKALNAKLYVPTWILRSKLERIARNKQGRIALAVENEQPVAVAIHDVFGQFMVFVHPEHRRKKIGTKLIDQLIEHFNLDKSHTFAGYGAAGSGAFWKQVGINMDM